MDFMKWKGYMDGCKQQTSCKSPGPTHEAFDKQVISVYFILKGSWSRASWNCAGTAQNKVGSAEVVLGSMNHILTMQALWVL
jgi:hypothetical protein